ncbi:hypothetical protein [Actinokineospora sp. NBRC 105648]|uniref:hypothetical protein n=1 Tax=Actinokineospora sp. NBRC 105648 TaxID=3032206 RepID=UPI0024A0A103|nr:hypothetical protein [Actinokineospora sp. NBRC 105648]GLZ40318.1 hypothetical protein Acsp05_39420 [Actinokineospora sp. NBRC 105648]
MSDIEYVRMVAETVLARLGDQAAEWRLLSVGEAPERVSPFPLPKPFGDLPPSRELRATVMWKATATGAATVGYYNFSLDVPVPLAVAAMADQIQDHAIEESWGAALPPCPDHQHPLSVTTIDGVVSWACPKDPQHHCEPLLPRT